MHTFVFMKKILLLLVAVLSFTTATYAQGADCTNADPFCSTGTSTFPASTSTTAATGPDYGCLGSQPNPAWYYLQVGTSGPINLNMSNSAAVDIDFICWGPFTSAAAGCASGLNSSAVDCSFSTAATETCSIPSAVAGEVYILLITNYSGQSTNISVTQTNSGSSGAGSTDCSILCAMTGLTASPGACNPATNTYTVTGNITYNDPPATGTLTITNSCSGVTQVINAPFTATGTSYSLAGLPANGAGCTVTAVFSADPSCTLTQSFTAPPSCATVCSISSVTAVPTACNTTTNLYNVSGSVTFSNAPATGTLTITNSCGGTPVVLNAPFTSPSAYSFNGLTSNGASCSVTAVFSANTTCTLTQTYAAPAACITTCAITAVTATPTACNGATQQYSVSGNVTFVNAPSTGTLTINNSCGGSPVVLNAPFTSPAPYSFTALSANGAACSITAVFSATPTCTLTQSYAAPAPCPPCVITSISGTPSACDPLTNTYSVSGTLDFNSPPSTGTLTITNSCGGTVVTLSPPFVSPVSYSFTGLASNGASCSITAVFSAVAGCTITQGYSAPPSCTACPISAANNGPICRGDSLFLIATPISGATYSWTGPDGFTSTSVNPVVPNAGPNAEGTYSVTVVTPAPACTSSATTTFALLPNPTPVVSPDMTIYYGTSATLIATGGTNYNWSPPTDLSCTSCDTTIATPLETTTYCVTVTENGCIDSSCVKVYVHIPCSTNENLETPNAFTPNGDGYNDEFCLSGWDACVSSFQIVIFDRWGEKVFESKDASFCWDGRFRGKMLDPAVFVYYIKATYIVEGASPNDKTNLKDITRRGNVSLVR